MKKRIEKNRVGKGWRERERKKKVRERERRQVVRQRQRLPMITRQVGRGGPGEQCRQVQQVKYECN